MIVSKPWLDRVNRIHTVTEDKSKYILRIDQNERIDNFDDNFFNDFIKTIKHTDICSYPSTAEFLHRLGRYSHANASTEIFLSSGSDQIIKSVFETFVNIDDEVITTDPCFPMYSVYAKLFNSKLIKVPYDTSLRFNINNLLSYITDKTKLIIIANPNSPIGDWHPATEFEQLFNETSKRGIVVLIDEAYVEFAPSAFDHIINEYDNVILSRTFSKGLNAAGIRLGYMLANKNIIDLVSKWRHMHPLNGIAIRFGIYILDNISYIEKHISDTIIEKVKIVLELEENNFDIISTYGNWIHFNTKDDNEITSKILNSYKDIATRDSCIIPYDYRKNWVRMTIGPNLSEYDFFKEILKQGV